MIRGQGMPSRHDYGNMYIQFGVKFPEKNWTQDPAAFDALRKVLPSPELINTAPAEAMAEPADLEDVDNTSRGFGGAMEEDEEHEHHGGERVQCASQ